MSHFFTFWSLVFFKCRTCISFPVNQVAFCRISDSFPPYITVFSKSTVCIDCILFCRNKSVLVRLSRSSWCNTKETSFWVDSIKTTIFSEFHPGNIITYSFYFPTRDSRNQHSQVCFTTSTWESTCYVFYFTLRVCKFKNKHVFSQPAFITCNNSSNTESETFLSKKSVSTVSRTVRPDEAFFWEMRDVFVFYISTWPDSTICFTIVQWFTN